MAEDAVEDMEQSQQAETSKAGAKRMRRLLTPPIVHQPSTSAIHPHTKHLIYPSPSPNFIGHLLTPLFSARAPRPLPTPQVLAPGRELSISPTGEWITIFHPNPPVPNQISEGGTLAIYPASILSPISTPSTRTTIPLATFPLPCNVLAIQYLYPPRSYIPDGRAKGRGPAPPIGYESTQGPAVVILTATNLILLHPQRINPAEQTSPYMMGMLTCPLHTRWHAAPGGSMPPETGWRVGEGWMGLVGDDEGVWVGWGRKGEVGVIRAEVGSRDGVPYLRTTPMPPMPDEVPTTEVVKPRRVIQGISFFRLPNSLASNTNTNTEESMATDPPTEASKRNIVGAALIIHESSPDQKNGEKTNINVVGHERREVELAEGFSEMGASGEVDGGSKSWDWFTLPDILQTTHSSSDTSILSLNPLLDIPPYTLSLAVIQTSNELRLVHLDLCPEGDGSSWRILGDGISLDYCLSGEKFELVPSQAVQRGLRGLVAVVVEGQSPTLVIMPSIPKLRDEEDGMDDEGSDLVKDAAIGVVLAIKQGHSYADVIRATLGPVPPVDQIDLVHNILRQADQLIQEDLTIDGSIELHRLQTTLFSNIRDVRRFVSSEIVKLHEASNLFNLAASPSSSGLITFDLDTVWSLLPVSEWVISILADLLRLIILYKGNSAWSPAPNIDSIPSRLFYVLDGNIRDLLIKLLSQVQAFKGFLDVLEEPILQPASRFMPVGRRRDPRATILAKERGRDLGVREGLNIEMWGKALEAISNISDDRENAEAYKTAYLTLSPAALLNLSSAQTIFDKLPSPSSLLLSASDSHDASYDAIMFEPIQINPGSVAIRCDRCSWSTRALGLEIELVTNDISMGGENKVGTGEGWRKYTKWRRDREGGCGCGGTWTRETVSKGENR